MKPTVTIRCEAQELSDAERELAVKFARLDFRLTDGVLCERVYDSDGMSFTKHEVGRERLVELAGACLNQTK